MSAATEDRITVFKEGKWKRLPVAGSTKIYKGTQVCKNVSGNMVPAADTAGLVFMGIALETVDNSAGSDGDLYVKLERDREFEMLATGLTQADLGATVYARYDNEVAKSTTNSVEVGKITEVLSATSCMISQK